MNIIAPATAAGVGAIAVIRISGPEAIVICNKNFKGKNLESVAANTVHFGTIRSNAGDIIDEVLVTVFRAPHSYTRENTVEISCHGSPYIVQKILELFLQNGCAMAQPGEFTQRAFLNGQLDLSQAEAVGDLIASESETQHRLAIQQMRGGFSAQIKDLRKQLIHFASMIELELDFGEEDVEFADRNELNALVTKIISVLEHLLLSFQLGNVLKNGVQTVIAGRPNAGKSTLLNALLNEERAIVSSIAGTTRDTIEEVLTIQGVQFRLIDTAGIRAATDTIEAIGVEKALEKVRASSLILYVADATEHTPSDILTDLENILPNFTVTNTPILIIFNKIDAFASAADFTSYQDLVATQLPKNAPLQAIYLSAQHKTNLDDLRTALYRTATGSTFSSGDIIVTNARHAAALSVALTSLQAAVGSLQSGISSDFIAIDIRHAIHALGLVVGEVSTDDLLEKIFRDFCIGK
jgi:tRNA modification GTPase